RAPEWSLVTMAWNIKRLFALASPPDKAEVRRLGRQAPGNAISGPSTAFCTRPNAPTLLRPAKTILGDQPQSPVRQAASSHVQSAAHDPAERHGPAGRVSEVPPEALRSAGPQ